MFLGCYHFDGQPAARRSAHERLFEDYLPESLDPHVYVLRTDGLSVDDACSTAQISSTFSTSSELAAAVAASGLPSPRVEPHGHVEPAVIRQSAVP